MNPFASPGKDELLREPNLTCSLLVEQSWPGKFLIKWQTETRRSLEVNVFASTFNDPFFVSC